MLTGSVTDFELPSPLKCQGTSVILLHTLAHLPVTSVIYLLAFGI